MKINNYIALVIASACTVGALPAQDGDSDEKNITRTLRVMIAGERPMPVFETRGDKVVEVDPSESLIPPSSFEFSDPTHAPRSADDEDVESAYSAWPNEVVRVNKYKGPSTLQLKVRRSDDEGEGAGDEVKCNLGKAVNPFVLIHASASSSGWDEPVARVLDMSPDKVPARSVTVFNLSDVALKVYVTKDGKLVPARGYATIRLPKGSKETFRYKIDASDGKEVVTVSNSSYNLKKDSRLLIVALPGQKSRRAAFRIPGIRMIPDPVAVK